MNPAELSFIAVKPRKHRRRGSAPLAVPSLVLIAATFDPDGPEIYLTFDRPVDISSLVVTAFEVKDGANGHRLIGFNTPLFITPSEVFVPMQIVEAFSGPDVLLTAGAANGIVAVDDGATWEGVTELVLPFG